MAGEVDHIRKVRDKLNEVSPSFCLAKWLQVSLHLGLSGNDKTKGGGTHSCHHPLQHAIPLAEIKADPSALHNTKYKKVQMQKMLDGERPEECNYCWTIEDLPGNHLSDRAIKSANGWASIDRIQDVLKHGTTTNINPTYVEVSFSNVCNFKCSYCSPTHSSQWVHEIKQHGPYPTSQGFNDLGYLEQVNRMPLHHLEDNPYLDAFWEWWPELSKTLEVFRVTGGEPLLDKNTFRILDSLYNEPNPNMEFAINTNCCVPEKALKSFISKMKLLLDDGKIGSSWIYTSVDSHGEQAEYGRNGLDYDIWLNNIDRLLTELPTTKMTIMCTANVFSITTFKKLLEDVLVLKLKHYNDKRKVPLTIDISMLHWPGHQSVAILPASYADYMTTSLDYMKQNQEGKNGNDYYQGFHEFEIAKMERFIEFMKNEPKSTPVLNSMMRDFYIFVNEHDKRRNTDFLKTFPELLDFYNNCKIEHDKRII